MKIDIHTIQSLSKDKKKRSELGKNNTDIKSNMYPFSKDFLFYLESLSTFEIASIILDKNNWILSRTNAKPSKSWIYNEGDIIMIYLGSSNYGYEPSYFHPAVVIANLFDSVLIIPCSSTIPKHNRCVIGSKSDGFRNNTAILVDKLRVIDKQRIQRNASGGVVGSLNKSKLNEVKDKIISLYLPKTEGFIEILKEQNIELEKQNIELEKQNIELEKQNIELKEQNIELEKQNIELKEQIKN